jgi:hypothetical protein
MIRMHRCLVLAPCLINLKLKLKGSTAAELLSTAQVEMVTAKKKENYIGKKAARTRSTTKGRARIL